MYEWGIEYFNWIPAKGWIITIGLLEPKIWRGKFYGNFSPPVFLWYLYYTGAIGFTGIRLQKNSETYYLGSALWVKLTYDTPYP